MSQKYDPPAVGDKSSVAWLTKMPNSLDALLTCHSGTVAPTTTQPFMLWADTTTNILKVRNAGDSAWLNLLSIAGDNLVQVHGEGWAGTLSATKTDYLGGCPRAGTVKHILLLTSTVSTSSSGNEWVMQVKNYPAATPGSPVDLFSGTVGTFTSLGGVGGGAETVADQAYILTPDQNAAVAALDQLELVMTKSGTATTLNNFRAYFEMN